MDSVYGVRLGTKTGGRWFLDKHQRRYLGNGEYILCYY